jgi:glutamine amidotransferase-like uncharacterized protein
MMNDLYNITLQVLGALFIKKYLLFAFLILGLTLSLNVIGTYGATPGTLDIKNTSLTHNEGSSATVSSSSIKTVSSNAISKSVSSTSTRKVIRVVVYSGKGTIASCVVGVKNGLVNANNNYLVPGYRFSYSTTRTITSSVLSHYDVLVMPGGSSGLNYVKTISSTVIRKYVSSGHGYVGICAGAYSGSKYVDGMYSAWGLAPHVYSKHPNHEGNLPVSITSTGSKLFGYGGGVTLVHYNGPALYAKGPGVVTFATYADNHIGYKGYGAIVGESFYKGRTVLSGPHPELTPQNPGILSKLIAWAAKATVNNSLTVRSTSPVNGAVNVAASKIIKITFNKPIKTGHNRIELKTSSGNLISINKSISGNTLTISHPLLIKGIKYILVLPSGSITDLDGKSMASFSTAFQVSSISLAQMKDGLARAQAFYNTNHRLPNYVTIGTFKMPIGQFLEIIGAYGLKLLY